MRIADAQPDESFWSALVGDGQQCASIEALAERFTHRLYEHFVESIVLVRVFATIRFDRLPERERAFARDIAEHAGGSEELTAGTDVLTLLGTRGARERWNARYDSQGHLAIPLLSETFVSEIPMIARLLGETGFVPLFARPAHSQYVTRAADGNDNLFFVGDARLTTDERGRLIIPAADFVSQHGVKTVFGFGGAYASRRTFVTTIVFCRDTVARPAASRLVTLGRDFKQSSEELLQSGAVFA